MPDVPHRDLMPDVPHRDLVCVLCGRPWPMFANVCKCGGFSTWGERKGGPPSSWDVAADGSWSPKPVPTNDREPAAHETKCPQCGFVHYRTIAYCPLCGKLPDGSRPRPEPRPT